jgi:hypothetical protein
MLFLLHILSIPALANGFQCTAGTMAVTEIVDLQKSLTVIS